MKLMDYSTNEAADILCELAPLMDNITTDTALMEKIGKAIDREGMTKIGLAMEALHRVFSSVPVLFGPHRDDIFGIVAVVNRKNAAEIAAQPLRDTKNQLKEILNDEELLDFFDMFGLRVKTA